MPADSNPQQTQPVNREQKRQFWHAHILDQEHSDLAQRAYCQAHGLNYASFTRWRGLILKERAKSPHSEPSQFVPVQMPALQASSGEYDHALELVLRDGTRIEGITSNNVSVATALIAQL